MRETKKALDNTSSVLIVSTRPKRPSKKMAAKKPYEVEYRGVVIRCETPEAAANLARMLGGEPDNPLVQEWHPDEFLEFVNRIQITQRRLLAALLETKGQSLKDFELRMRLTLSSNQALAGVLSGITKVAKLLDIDPKRIYIQHTTYSQGLPERRYWVSSAFQKAAADADWPSQSDLEEQDEDK
jgi:hypothetical protein